MGQYLTPDTSDGTYLCRRLRFRAELAGFITGALIPLINVWAWDEFGTMTPQEAANYSLESLNYYLDSGDRCMVGEVWIGITADYPSGVLPFDGTTYERVDYPALYSVIDTAFIVDADHFTLLEAAGRALVAAGAGTGLTARAVGDSWGDERVALATSEMPEHDHNYDKAVAAVSTVLGVLEGVQIGAYASTATSAAGDGETHENQAPRFAVKVGVWAM